MNRLRIGICALLWVVAACGSDGSNDTVDGGSGSALFGEPCEDGSECESNFCVQVAGDRGVCSGTCDPEHPCPDAPNWFCIPHDDGELDVCACQGDAADEVCGDGIDNDCDGIVDCAADRAAPMMTADAVDDGDGDGVGPAAMSDAGAMGCPGAAGCEPPPVVVDPCQEDPTQCGGCVTDADCDDGIACTRDYCLGRSCVHPPSDGACEDDEVCTLTGGCVPARACATHADCADDDACTRAEYCDAVTRVCRFGLLDGDGDERYPMICGGTDCNDSNGAVYPGSLEVCDGLDNDCDGVADPPEASAYCGPGRTCVSGACVCDQDHVACGGRCLDPDLLLDDRYNCGSCGRVCGTGLACEDGECVDVDECAQGPVCGTHSTCTNVSQSFTCSCESGYSSTSGGANCSDIDECGAGTDDCDDLPDACANTDGSFTCTCPGGYSGDGRGPGGCLDVDECRMGSDDCDVAQRCVNVGGSFACSAPVLQVATGASHTCALLEGGRVRCWGSNSNGQLGLGDTTARNQFDGEIVDLGTDRTATRIALGNAHTCAILEDGSVKCWGSNADGRLGIGGVSTPRGDGPGEMGEALPAVQLGTDRTAVALGLGQWHSCALLDDGSVKCWGRNHVGQLGKGHTTTLGDSASEMGDALLAIDLGTDRSAKAIAVGWSHNCALLDDDSVKCWGYNNNGQLGQGTALYRGDNADEMGDELLAVELGDGRTARAITAGAAHTCAILDDDSVKCWGNGTYGQPGQGGTATIGDGAGELGNALLPIALGAGRTAVAIEASDYHTCALLDDGSVKCWGRNDYGQLGLGDTGNRGDGPDEMGADLPAIDLGTGHTLQALGGGHGWHSCALLGDDTIKCWGYNAGGQLGHGDAIHRGDGPSEMGDHLPGVPVGP